VGVLSLKEIVILGGPNGAGKTTGARLVLPEFFQCNEEFLNADEIARKISPHAPESAAFAAGRELLERMKQLIGQGQSFAVETTCSGRSYIPILKDCKANGWRITFFYFWLPRPEDSIARVARRVSEGGHNISAEVIYRRFRTGLWNALNLYLPLADRAEFYDNSDTHRILIAQKHDASLLLVIDPGRWAQMLETAR